MSNLTNIYKNENGEIKLLDTLNYTLDEFKSNPVGCYPDWDTITMIASETKYEHPTIDTETQGLREKTREERILEGETELLQDGEYLENGKIVTVPTPENLYRRVWDKKEHTWREGMTEEEFIKMRVEKILKYSELEENKKALESSKFSSTDEIQMITEEMAELEKEINALAEKIKVFKI